MKRVLHVTAGVHIGLQVYHDVIALKHRCGKKHELKLDNVVKNKYAALPRREII